MVKAVWQMSSPATHTAPAFPYSMELATRRLVVTDRLSMSCIGDFATREIVGEFLLGSSRVCVCFNVNLDIDIGCR